MVDLHSRIDKTHHKILGEIALYQQHVEPKLHQPESRKGTPTETASPSSTKSGEKISEKKDAWRVTAEREALKEKERKERRDRLRAMFTGHAKEGGAT